MEWEYEPVEFVLEWDERGRPKSAFRPDFYLPDLDLFLELTTLRQDLVTRKHRKLRRFRQLYPDRTVKLLYRRDDAHLLARSRLAATIASSVAPAESPPRRGERRDVAARRAAAGTRRRLVG